MNLNIRNVTAEDLTACSHIEKNCFEESEAASPESIRTRIETYPDGFIVAESKGRVVGMVNSGATDKEDITDEGFKKLIGHKPEGKNIVIFSMSVLPEYQKKGVAKQLLTVFIKRAEALKKENILLLCKTNLIGFYEKFGFQYRCLSKSTHGGFEWHEMLYIVQQ